MAGPTGALTVGSIIALLEGDEENYVASLKRAVRETEKAAGSTHGIWRGMLERVGHRMVDGVLRLASAALRFMKDELVGSVKYAIDFEKALAEIGTLGPTNLEKVEESLLAISKTLGKSPKDLASAWYDAVSAGINQSIDKTKEFVSEAAKLATVGLTSVTNAVNLSSSAVKAYGEDMLSAAHANDVYFAAVQKGKLRMEELVPVMGRVLPLASALKVPFEELMAAMAKLTTVGFPVAEAATSIKALMTEMVRWRAKETDAFKDFKQQAEEYTKIAANISAASRRIGGARAWERFLGDIAKIRPIAAEASEIGLSFDKIATTIAELSGPTGNRRAIASVKKAIELLVADSVTLERQLQMAGISFESAFDFLVTGIKGGLTPAAAMKNLQEYLDKSVGSVRGIREAAQEGLGEFIEKMGELPGGLMANVRAVEALSAALSLQSEDWKAWGKDWAGLQILVAEEFEKMNETTFREMEKLLASHERLQLKIGESLLPEVRDIIAQATVLLDRITGAMESLAKYVDAAKKTVGRTLAIGQGVWKSGALSYVPGLNMISGFFPEPRTTPPSFQMPISQDAVYGVAPEPPRTVFNIDARTHSPSELAFVLREASERYGRGQPSVRGVFRP